jgi:hypothetical protein
MIKPGTKVFIVSKKEFATAMYSFERNGVFIKIVEYDAYFPIDDVQCEIWARGGYHKCVLCDNAMKLIMTRIGGG